MIEDKLRAELPLEMASRSSFFRPGAMKRSFEADWHSRVGSFAGRTAKIGDAWTLSTTQGFGGLGRLDQRIRYEIAEWVDCGESDCVRLVMSFEADPPEVEEFLAELFTALLEKAGVVGSLRFEGASLSGTGERIVEPSTLLLHDESRELTVTATALGPRGQEEVVIRERETLTRDYS